MTDGTGGQCAAPWLILKAIPLLRLRFLAALLGLLIAFSASAQPFQFVALGDLPYGSDEKAGPPYRALIAAINRENPAFSIHVGDIKSGATPCSNEEFQRQLRHFSLFEAGVVYTPGDNEWADCHRASNGSYDPMERLQTLRRLFYQAGRSLGKQPVLVQNQSSLMPAHARFIENQRWLHRQVMFATVHVVGGNNNFNKRRAQALAEFMERDRANVAWFRDTFAQARAQNARAVVIAMQANPLGLFKLFSHFGADSGFRASIQETLLPLVREAGVPVLLVHGDTHTLRFDQPFTLEGQALTQLTRLEVPGAGDVRAVQVRVDLENPQPFSIRLVESD